MDIVDKIEELTSCSIENLLRNNDLLNKENEIDYLIYIKMDDKYDIFIISNKIIRSGYKHDIDIGTIGDIDFYGTPLYVRLSPSPDKSYVNVVLVSKEYIYEYGHSHVKTISMKEFIETWT